MEGSGDGIAIRCHISQESSECLSEGFIQDREAEPDSADKNYRPEVSMTDKSVIS